jgi:hypothetical protein
MARAMLAGDLPTQPTMNQTMATEYDRYREALVIETYTIWPEDFDGLDPAQRMQIEQRLHAEPEKAAELRYERLHSGFARVITVTPEDLARTR